MSAPEDGRNMGRPPLQGGSVKRARERAEAGLPREDFSSLPQYMPPSMGEEPQVVQPSAPRRPAVGPTAGQSKIPRPQGDGGIGLAISRPTQVPQWPLQGPLLSPVSSVDSEPYKPPAGSQPPPRPPRPSRVPSILDGSKVQDHTPVFQYRPQSGRDSSSQELSSVPETPTTTMSRPSTLSSVGTIPDFPLPVQLPIAPPRRSVNLGPPPSARRGASSFYSNASYVSPIPEESPRSRSHASYASSAAMPESWGTASPGPSPNYPDAYYDDIIEESGQSAYGDDDQDEARLVRSASIGKRAKPTLVSATTPRTVDTTDETQERPGPSPLQAGPFKDGTGYLDGSNSSGTLPTKAAQVVTADTMLNAVNAASSTDPSSRATPSPQPPPGGRPYSRLSAIRRPPRLDIDAVRKAESRGSLTSLPDLIRRATRLAASLERGRRPASRFDDLNDYPNLAFGGRDGEKEMSYLDAEKHQSGLSDMLAAFPPPAQAPLPRRSIRESIRASMQWPLPSAFGGGDTNTIERDELAPSPPATTKNGRRCCGLPLWGFIIVLIVIIILIAAAVIIPIELFVVRRPGSDNQALQQCQQQITCQNGGMNIVTNGFCSCICTNGFTGFDCTVPDSVGCASSTPTDSNVNNATVGEAIPRLIQQAQLNFSIPLSQAMILGKLNSGNLSCTAENALVTFNGQSSRLSSSSSLSAANAAADAVAAKVINGVEMTTITILVSGPTTITLRAATAGPPLVNSPLVSPTISASIQLGAGTGFTTIVPAPTSFSTIFATTISFSTSLSSKTSSSSSSSLSSPSTTQAPTMTSTFTTTMTMSSPTASVTPVGSTFAVTEDVLDFSRVAVLFVLQLETLDSAKTAQTLLQSFFTDQASTASPIALQSARNVTIGNGNSVNLVTFQITTPNGTVGGTRSTRRR